MADREEIRKQRVAALQRQREQSEQQIKEAQEAANSHNSSGVSSVLKSEKVSKCFSSFTQGAFMGNYSFLFYQFQQRRQKNF